MRTGMTLTCAALLLGGCGNADETEPTNTEPEVAATTQAPATLAETCPEIEQGLPAGYYPTPDKWSDYLEQLQQLGEQGDTETQNAVGIITPAVDTLSTDPDGMILLDARAELRDGLDTLAKRCKAVGSSALQ